MREIFITDIHSQFTKFDNLLKSANYNKEEDLLIVGGDYFDRGPESVEMAKWLEDNYENPNTVLLRGNHDLALISLVSGDTSTEAFLDIEFMKKCNGLDVTLEALVGKDYHINMSYKEMTECINKRFPRLLSALESTKYYHETDKAIYTHAKLPENYASRYKKTWDRAVWTNSDSWANSMNLKTRTDIKKPIYIGHYALPNYKDWDGETPKEINGVFFCDGGLGWDGQGLINIIEN